MGFDRGRCPEPYPWFVEMCNHLVHWAVRGSVAAIDLGLVESVFCWFGCRHGSCVVEHQETRNHRSPYRRRKLITWLFSSLSLLLRVEGGGEWYVWQQNLDSSFSHRLVQFLIADLRSRPPTAHSNYPVTTWPNILSGSWAFISSFYCACWGSRARPTIQSSFNISKDCIVLLLLYATCVKFQQRVSEGWISKGMVHSLRSECWKEWVVVLKTIITSQTTKRSSSTYTSGWIKNCWTENWLIKYVAEL